MVSIFGSSRALDVPESEIIFKIMKQNKEVRMSEMKKAFRAVRKAEKVNGPVPLVPVMKKLDSSYTFDELKLGRLFLD